MTDNYAIHLRLRAASHDDDLVTYDATEADFDRNVANRLEFLLLIITLYRDHCRKKDHPLRFAEVCLPCYEANKVLGDG